MSDKQEALRLAAQDYLDGEAAKELRRLHAENERLNNALQWEQNRFERIGTHGPGCHTWGPRHYECLLREYKSLLEALETLVEHFEYYMGDNECRPLENARAAIAKVTGEQA